MLYTDSSYGKLTCNVHMILLKRIISLTNILHTKQITYTDRLCCNGIFRKPGKLYPIQSHRHSRLVSEYL